MPDLDLVGSSAGAAARRLLLGALGVVGRGSYARMTRFLFGRAKSDLPEIFSLVAASPR